MAVAGSTVKEKAAGASGHILSLKQAAVVTVMHYGWKGKMSPSDVFGIICTVQKCKNIVWQISKVNNLTVRDGRTFQNKDLLK